MKFILLNPTFTKEPIEITNEKAIDQIKSYIRVRGCNTGDVIPVYAGQTTLKLKLISKDVDVSDSSKNVYRFKTI